MSSYTPQYLSGSSVGKSLARFAKPLLQKAVRVADAQARVDAARAQVIAAGQAIKNAKSPVIKAAAEQLRIQANDALIIAQNDLRLAKNPQAKSTVINSSTGTTVSDIQKYYSQPPSDGAPSYSTEGAPMPWLSDNADRKLPQVQTKPKTSWVPIAVAGVLAVTLF